ncbi:MAG: glycosyltransferase [Pseudonocardiaceae bacterium]
MVTRPQATGFLVATVGTDHHPFDRLVRWLDRWLAERYDVKAWIQHGPACAPRHGDGVVLLPRDELLDYMTRATVIVTQGGPGSIMDARSCGRLPVVVPRLPTLNEVVDDHQLAFCRKMADLGWIRLAESEAEFREHLDHALDDGAPRQLLHDRRSIEQTVLRVGDVLTDVSRKPARPLRIGRLAQLVRSALTGG